MNKIIIFLFSILIILTSCKKDETLNKDNQSTDINVSIDKEGGGISGKRAVYYDCVWDDFGNCNWLPIDCGPPASNCLDDVVVIANPAKSADEVIIYKSQVYAEFLDSFNSNTIPDFFINSNYEVLFPELADNQEIISEILNGKITLHYKLGLDGLNYYIALPSNIEFNKECEGYEKFVLPIIEK